MTHPLFDGSLPAESGPAPFRHIAPALLRPAPLPGQDTREICRDILGFDDSRHRTPVRPTVCCSPTTEQGARMTQVYIGGRFRPSDDVTPVIEAATGEPLGDGANASAADIDDAVAAARSALPGWRATPPAARADLLRAMAAALKSRARATNELVTRENGMPIVAVARRQRRVPGAAARYYADLITELPDRGAAPERSIGHTIVRREPVGVWSRRSRRGTIRRRWRRSSSRPRLPPAARSSSSRRPRPLLDALVFG